MAANAPDRAARFITFEGGEGVGKSTQVKRLLERLSDNGIGAVRTREPGGTARAEAIRSFILSGKPESWGTGAEAVLFASARLDHVNELIAPNLGGGKWVVSDRFHDSTRAYQGLTGGVSDKLINALETLALNGYMPDLTIVLDMEPKDAFERVEQRALEDGIPISSDRFEREALEWHEKLRGSFIQIVDNNKDRCVLLSASQNEDDLADEIWACISERFPEVAAAASA